MGELNETNKQDRRLEKLQRVMVELERAGVKIFVSPAYGTYKPSTFVVIENTKIENGKIRSLEC